MFSKVARCVPLKNKSTTSLTRALDALFTYDDQPLTLQTDKCLEFLKRGVPGLLKRYGIDHIATHNGGGGEHRGKIRPYAEDAHLSIPVEIRDAATQLTDQLCSGTKTKPIV